MQFSLPLNVYSGVTVSEILPLVLHSFRFVFVFLHKNVSDDSPHCVFPMCFKVVPIILKETDSKAQPLGMDDSLIISLLTGRFMGIYPRKTLACVHQRHE